MLGDVNENWRKQTCNHQSLEKILRKKNNFRGGFTGNIQDFCVGETTRLQLGCVFINAGS